MTDFVREGRDKERPVMPPPAEVRSLLKKIVAGLPNIRRADEKELNDEQEKAVRALVGSRDVVNVLDAGQGTGKTETMTQYSRILSRFRVGTTWLGTTHTAVRELTERVLPAMTVASFLKSQEEQQKAAGKRIIVDESSMLAHHDAYRLLMYAKEHGCRIDFIGDSKQYKSPTAGDTMRLLTSRCTGLVPITMKKTIRQQGRLKEAMEAIRDGKVLDGHDMLNALGCMRELPLDQLTQTAAELYLQWSAKRDHVPVISPTRAQGDEIAIKIRQGLQERGDLKGEDHIVRRLVDLQWSPAQLKEAKEQGAEGVVLTRYGAYRDDKQALAVGDLVRTTMGGKTKDVKHRLCNGTRYSIKGFTKADDPILNNGWVVDKDWGGLAQRYVSTGQGAQGITENRAIVVYGTPSLVATRQEGFYVPVSHVRKEVAVRTDSNSALREAIQRQESRKSAMALMHPLKRQRMPVRQRLGKHLAYLRRLATFARTHERLLSIGSEPPMWRRISAMREKNAGTPAHLREYMPHVAAVAAKGPGAGSDREDESCAAFGFLRGLDARAVAVEFRLRTGNSQWFAYSCLVSWRHNPSAGLLLKFTTGDGVSLVLIHGGNLETPVGEARVNLTDRGLQRHRISYIREMDEDELKKVHQKREPTIDRIDIDEFETVEEQREWLKARAPVFIRKQA